MGAILTAPTIAAIRRAFVSYHLTYVSRTEDAAYEQYELFREELARALTEETRRLKTRESARIRARNDRESSS